jgi:anti-sigma B factor antagonist
VSGYHRDAHRLYPGRLLAKHANGLVSATNDHRGCLVNFVRRLAKFVRAEAVGRRSFMSDRKIDIEEVNGVTVARFLEKKILDEANIDALGKEMFALVDEDGRRQIILDFSLVEYLSSAALGKLITMHKKVGTASGKLAMCNIQKEIMDVFKITQLNKVLTLCKDLDDALSKF